MFNPDPANWPLAVRRRLYEAAAAALGLAVIHGLISGDEAAAWLLLVVPVLGVARRNVPKA